MLGRRSRKPFMAAFISTLCSVGGLFAESPAGSFLNPSHSLPISARASRGIAEHPTRALHRQDEPSPSDLPVKKPSATNPAAESADQETKETEAKKDDKEDTEEEPEPEEKQTLLSREAHKIGGIEWSLLYTGETFDNMHGGISTKNAARYRGNIDFVMQYDTEANGLWNGGKFFVYTSNTHGQTLSNNFIGDYQLYSNIDSFPHPNLMQVSEYWYLHTFGEDVISVKLGKCDANADFAYMELAADFVQSSFTLSPNIQMPTWPNQALGAVGIWQPREKLTLSLGVYDGGSDGRLWGFSTVGSNGAFIIGQAKWAPQFGVNEDMPGTYRAGVWGHTGDFAYITDFDNNFVGTNGSYVTMEQLIWKEPETDEQGLGLFSQISAANAPAQFNVVDTHWSLGLLYRGLLAGRDRDTCGVGLTDVSFKSGTNATIERKEEVAIEAFYKIRLSPWATVQPDFQYIANPGGASDSRDAFVGGFRFQTAI